MSTQPDRPAAATTPPAATIAYGPDSDQVYDVRVPQRPRGSTVLLLHGGFWRPRHDRHHTTAQATALTQNGFHVAVVEYRRLDHAGWRVMREDLLAATAAVRADPDLPAPCLAMGHSAGGHLALWLQHQAVASGWLGTVALAPCADLRRTYDLGLGRGAATALMGSTPQQEPAAWRDADPSRLGPPDAPVRLVHGDQDAQVPIEVSQAYIDAVAGTRVHLDVVVGAGHDDLIDPESPHFDRTLRAADGLAPRA